MQSGSHGLTTIGEATAFASGERGPATQPDTALALFTARRHAECFTAEFLACLPANLHVYAAFEREALRVLRKGFKHYSARTIIEVLRHNSALADGDAAFKINDHATPGYARLFALLHPEQDRLFDFRDSPAARRDWGSNYRAVA